MAQLRRITGELIIEGEYPTIKDALLEAIRQGAKLAGAYVPIYCKWSHSVIDGKIKIGCETRSIEDWKLFLDSDKVIETPRNTPEFKQIEAVIRAYIAYLETLNS